MEKRRRRKTRTLAQFLRRYFLTTAFGVLAILAAAVFLFMAGVGKSRTDWEIEEEDREQLKYLKK